MFFASKNARLASLESVSRSQGSTAGIKTERPRIEGQGTLKVGDKTEKFSYEATPSEDGIHLSAKNDKGEEASGKVKLFSSIKDAFTHLVQNKNMRAAAALAGMALGTASTSAAIIPDGANYQDYLNLGAANAGNVVWVKGFTSTGGTTIIGSGIAVDQYDVIMTYHEYIGSPYGLALVGNSHSYAGSPAPTSAIKDVVVNQGAFNTNGVFNSSDIDMVLAHLATALPVNPITFATATPASNAVLLNLGYGKHGPANGSPAPVFDGNLQGFYAPFDQELTTFDGSYYIDTDFDSTSGLSLAGNGFSGDSGGEVINSLGQVVGMMDAISPTSPSELMSTADLNLTNPEIQSWIVANLDSPSDVPEPSSVGFWGLLL